MNKKSKNEIFIASDHAGFEHKEFIKNKLTKKGFEVFDLGCYNKESCDYPDFAKILAKKVLKKKIFGILICGTGIGMSITANRFRGIRAALCTNSYMAKVAREHNDANILCLGSRILSKKEALKISEIFLTTEFSGEIRHKRRIRKIDIVNTKTC
ncbi:MAG: ribose 5-phosphate isomerase B [Candidatus Diapherotrites archaeon]|nr:ribose 5-phosphate isomerase B [Candidatus Diapherotrites archaeon]